MGKLKTVPLLLLLAASLSLDACTYTTDCGGYKPSQIDPFSQRDTFAFEWKANSMRLFLNYGVRRQIVRWEHQDSTLLIFHTSGKVYNGFKAHTNGNRDNDSTFSYYHSLGEHVSQIGAIIECTPAQSDLTTEAVLYLPQDLPVTFIPD